MASFPYTSYFVAFSSLRTSRTNLNLFSFLRWATFSRWPSLRLSTAVTSYPSSRSLSTTWLAMKPAPPVTSALMP